MGFIAMLIIGLLAGLLAKAIMPGRDPGGVIITILLGIVGSFIGGFVGRALLGYGVNDAGDINRPGFFMSLILATVGAIVVLAVYRLIKGRSLTV